jgi:hypothetical protein
MCSVSAQVHFHVPANLASEGRDALSHATYLSGPPWNTAGEDLPKGFCRSQGRSNLPVSLIPALVDPGETHPRGENPWR